MLSRDERGYVLLDFEKGDQRGRTERWQVREREREGEGIVCWRTRVSRISGRKGVVRLRESVIETRREVKRGEDNVIVE